MHALYAECHKHALPSGREAMRLPCSRRDPPTEICEKVAGSCSMRLPLKSKLPLNVSCPKHAGRVVSPLFERSQCLMEPSGWNDAHFLL